LTTLWTKITDESKAFNNEDRVLLRNSIQNLNKNIQGCHVVVSNISNILYLANMDIRQMSPKMIDEMGVDLEDDEQMHVFEGLRKTNDRLNEKLAQTNK